MSDQRVHPTYFMCHVCSHNILIKDGFEKAIVCDRCGSKTRRLKPKSLRLTLAFSLTALIFYVPANIFPFMTIELYGDRNSSTIWGGVISLSTSGSWLIAVIVFLASILIPFLKLVILFYLALTANNQKHRELKTRLYHAIEAIGRWSMLDIFLLAILVAIVKLGHWTAVEPQTGSFLFALVVVFTMLASANFDPKLLWMDKNDED